MTATDNQKGPNLFFTLLIQPGLSHKDSKTEAKNIITLIGPICKNKTKQTNHKNIAESGNLRVLASFDPGPHPLQLIHWSVAAMFFDQSGSFIVKMCLFIPQSCRAYLVLIDSIFQKFYSFYCF